MQMHLVDKFSLKCIGVGVEIPELYKPELAKLRYTAIGRFRLDKMSMRTATINIIELIANTMITINL